MGVERLQERTLKKDARAEQASPARSLCNAGQKAEVSNDVPAPAWALAITSPEMGLMWGVHAACSQPKAAKALPSDCQIRRDQASQISQF